MADRTVKVTLDGNVSPFVREMMKASAATKAFTNELDTSTDRTAMLTQSLLAVGPALVPLSAAAIPAISGLTNQLGFAVAGAGVAVLAFQGVGDALKATNDYAIEPTEANLEKMNQALSELGPAGREFVGFLQEIRPQLQGLQDMAQAGLFPGMQSGIEDLMTRLPQVERIVGEIGGAIGDLMAEAGDNLADPRWNEFFTFIETEARTTLMDLGRTIGNLGEGFANLWMAFDPLSDQFSKSFLNMSRDFSAWTAGLSETEGFQEFLQYIERVGPKAWDTLGSLGNALLQVVEAAAPVGEVALPVISAIADALAAVADSPVGPALIGAAAGISAISRAVALYNVANGSALSGFLGKAGGAGAGLRVAAAGAGLLALSMTDLDEKLGLSNTASFAMAGMIAGPWGAAVGAGVGLAMDLASANDEAAAAFDRAGEAIMNNTGTLEEQAAALGAARDASSNDGIQGKVDQFALAELEEQYSNNADAAQNLRFEEAGLGDSMADTSDAARSQVDALLALIDAHNAVSDQILTSRDAQRAYEEAIDGAADSIKKNGKTLDDSTPAGRANAAALDQIANAWNNLDAAGRGAKGGINTARKEFVKAATDAGMAKGEAQQLADTLLNIAPPPPIDVTVNTDGEEAKLRRLQNLINGMNGKTVRVAVEGGTGGGITKNATGGAIEGPGTGTSDSILSLVSNGEHVLTASDVAKAGGQSAIYRMRAAIQAGTLPKFATGGAVSRYDEFSELEKSSKLDLARQQQRIRSIEESLTEKETVGKGKSKRRRLALRGLDRKVAELELRDAKAELRKMASDNKKLKRYGTQGQEEAIQKATDDAVEEADRIARDAADRFTSAKSSATDRFEIGSATSAAAVDRNLARLLSNSQTFLGLLGDLKSKGASPWLLGELVKAGPTGGAIKLARQYNTDQNALNNINVRASQIDQYTNAYAGLVGNSAFMAPGAWNSGVSSASQAPMVASIVGAEIAVGAGGLMTFVKGQIVMSQDNQAIEARLG